MGFSLQWLLWARGLRSRGSQALEHRFNSCGAWVQPIHNMWDPPGSGTKPDRQADSMPLSHQGSPQYCDLNTVVSDDLVIAKMWPCVDVRVGLWRRLSAEELIDLKIPWCWERLKSGGEENDRGWDGLDGITNSGDMSLSKLRALERQGGLAFCCPWGRKESDTTEQLNWTDLIAQLEFHHLH